MSLGKINSQFECWANDHYLLAELSWAMQDGEYVQPEMQYAWESWQASRAAVVVELPQTYESLRDGKVIIFEDLITSLDLAGVQVKV